MGKIWTAGSWYTGDDRLDISIDSKAPFGQAFAPHPDLERLPRDTDKAWAEYQTQYRERMKRVWHRNQVTFHKLLDKEEVTLVCSCAEPERCHRTLLAHYLNLADIERTHLRGERPRLALVSGPPVAAPPAEPRPQLGSCFAEGCPQNVLPQKLTCPGHWKLIPIDVQEKLRANFRRGQERDLSLATDAYLAAAREARAHIKAAEQRRQRGVKAGAR